MTHLVGDIVDVEAVADRRRRAGQATRLGRAADHAEPGHATAAGTDQMADVVIGRVDDGVDVVLVRGQVARGVRIRVGRRIGVDDEVVVRHQHHAHADLAFVDAVDAIHRRDDGRQAVDDATAMERGVFASRRHRQAIGAQGGARRHLRHHAFQVRRKAVGRQVGAVDLATHLLAAVEIALAIGDVVAIVARLERIDVLGAVGADDLGMETGRRQVEAQGRGRIVDALAEIGADLRIPRRQFVGHDRRLDDAELGETSVRQGQGQGQAAVRRSHRTFRRRLRQLRLQLCTIETQAHGLRRHDLTLHRGARDGGFVDALPEAIRRAVGSEAGACGAGEEDHGDAAPDGGVQAERSHGFSLSERKRMRTVQPPAPRCNRRGTERPENETAAITRGRRVSHP